MAFDARHWMRELITKLQDEFGDRLRFAGLQGSHNRGEATAGSDIDAIVVLDTLSFADLGAYRAIIDTMPEREKACGFVSGEAELLHWPKHDLFQLINDTAPLYGSLQGLVPQLDRSDVLAGVRTGASALYHEVCHCYLHGGACADDLKGAYKAAFFALQAMEYLRNGEYAPTKRALLDRLEGEERDILAVCMEWDERKDDRKAHPDNYFRILIDWSGGVLRRFGT